MRIKVLPFSIVALLFSFPALAQEPVPCDACTGYPEGAYMQSGGPELSGDVHRLSCQSGSWEDLDSSDPCDACSLALGTVCADGAVYAGTTVGGARMYVADADETANGGTYEYGGYLTDLNGDNASVAPELLDDGLANTNWLLANGTGDHEAAQVCRDRGPDWYLPAIEELGDIHANRAQLGAANLPTSTSWYWSSSERDNNSARIWRLSDGVQFHGNKGATTLVRCVRR
ncbi:hypothetical protein ACLIR7_08930 [Nitratireductor aquimarinus]|uniref:hypothetical protein n=1 Tax=Nitratireductor aquimarinus TaxID=889300 RepID=UPI00398EF144